LAAASIRCGPTTIQYTYDEPDDDRKGGDRRLGNARSISQLGGGWWLDAIRGFSGFWHGLVSRSFDKVAVPC